MSLSPRDMDFIALKQMAAREIALSLGVPPLLLGIPGDNTYSNYAEANRTFWRQTVIPLAGRLAQGLSRWLLVGEEAAFALRCDLDDLDALAADREALWARLDGASFLTRDEKRAAAGYAPIGEAEGKFNPYHDDAGRFTVAPGGGVTPVAAPPRGPKAPPPSPTAKPAPEPAPARPAPQPKPPAQAPAPPDFMAKRPGQGSLTGSLDGLTPAEQNFAREMVGLGKNVEVIPRGAGRTADFKIDGKTYELKTVSGVQKTDSDGLSSAISSRVMDGRGQAGDIIVDARQQQGMTRAVGERAAGRAYGADNASGKRGIESITILTPEGAVSTVRNN